MRSQLRLLKIAQGDWQEKPGGFQQPPGFKI